ncbi:MAG: radical SAM protein [Candidatus Aenigmarchaeota archaeon]|nr:radical SAM protein [Candidatus Aenigmarchaeota archaeon]
MTLKKSRKSVKGAAGKSPKAKAKVLEKTSSICPGCLKEGKIKTIDAQVIEEDGKIWITKKCGKHGSFKSIVFSDAGLYHRWMKYKVDGDGISNIEIKSWLSLKEKLYDRHLSQSLLTNIMLTNRCNLRCSYCFMNAGAAGYVYEPTLEELKKLMLQVRNEKPVPSKAIQLTGGEPTIREDLLDIIRMAKDLGFTHVQLNTNGIKLSESVEFCRQIKEAGVNTLYLSFDGMTKETNPWIDQLKQAIKNLREVGFRSVILVPVAMTRNLKELPKIIKYAAENIDVIRGVNFQPIAFAGRPQTLKDKSRLEQRTDYAVMMDEIEKGLDGQISRYDFYPVPFVYPFSKLVETIKGQKQIEFTANPMCGGATYVFVKDGRMIPITRFVNVEGLMDLVKEASQITGPFKKLRIGWLLLRNLSKYIDSSKAPEGLNMKSLLFNAAIKGTYDKLRDFHMSSLYIGTMWFQDPWNLNIDRLKRCVIHYTTFEGVVPFCAYNGIGIGDEIRKRHSISIKEWEKRTGKTMKDDLWKNGPISDITTA